MDGQRDEWMYGWMGGWVNGWMVDGEWRGGRMVGWVSVEGGTAVDM